MSNIDPRAAGLTPEDDDRIHADYEPVPGRRVATFNVITPERLAALKHELAAVTKERDAIRDNAVNLLVARCEVHTGSGMTWADFLLSGGDGCPVCRTAERDEQRQRAERYQAALVAIAEWTHDDDCEFGDHAYVYECGCTGRGQWELARAALAQEDVGDDANS